MGLLSALHDFIPMLTRLSILTKALFAAYHIARDWMWHGVREAFWWIHIRIPDIPVAWKDALVVTSLVLAALNYESLRRDRISLTRSFVRSLVAAAKDVLLGDTGGEYGSLFDLDTADASRTIVLLSVPVTLLLEGYLVRMLLDVFGIPSFMTFLPQAWRVPADSAILACVLFVCVLPYWRDPYLPAKTLVRMLVNRLGSILLFPVVLIALPMIGIIIGWRAVVVALTLIAILVATNFAFLTWVDPALQHPPAFLQRLIEADPAKLPKPQ